jgi:4-amino-4-deoxy-L-arabinose transferase-like glycosyltransferase
MASCGDEGYRQTAIAVWKGETVYEPQILERLVAIIYLVIGNEYLWVIRILNAIFWLVGGAALFILARELTSTDGAIVALTLYAILDFFVFINRAFLPETFMLMWAILASLALYRWTTTHNWKWALLAGILSGIATLVKVVAVFPIICMLILLVFVNAQWKLKRIFTDWQVWLVGLLLIFIPSLYYIFSIGQRSSGFFEFWTLSFIRLLFQPTFYIGWLSFLHGLVGLSLLGLGLCGTFFLPRPGKALVWGWWLGYLIFGLFLPDQVSSHDYYNVFLVPMLALSIASIGQLSFTKLATKSTYSQAIVLGIALTGILYSAWLTRSTIMANDMRQEITAWKRMGEELPTDGEIVALTQDYGYRLRYYGNRYFILWPYSWDYDLTLRRGGNVGSFMENFTQYTANAKYFMVSFFGELDAQSELKSMLYDHYPLVKQGDGYILFDLSQRLSTSP